MIYHIFTNDVGPNGFSCFSHLRAATESEARQKAVESVKRFAPVKLLVIPARYADISFVEGSGTSRRGLVPLRGVFKRYGKKIGRRS